MKNPIFINPSYTENSPIAVAVVGCGPSPLGFSTDYHEREHWIFHYIESGVCVYELDKKTYEVQPGSVFIIFPGTKIRYYAKANASFSCTYVDFNGTTVSGYISQTGFTRESPIARNVDTGFAEALKRVFYYQNDDASDFLSTAALFECFAYLKQQNISNRSETNEYVKKAIMYINSLYFTSISVSDISDYLHIDRTYLFKLFKEHTGVSPQEYLSNVQIEKAKEHLKAGEKVNEAAANVGFADSRHFSRFFKNKTGYSPSEYRKAAIRKISGSN